MTQLSDTNIWQAFPQQQTYAQQPAAYTQQQAPAQQGYYTAAYY